MYRGRPSLGLCFAGAPGSRGARDLCGSRLGIPGWSGASKNVKGKPPPPGPREGGQVRHVEMSAVGEPALLA